MALGDEKSGVTMADVADALGISKITVSRALSGHATVKPATREKVKEAAERLGYRMNVSGNVPTFNNEVIHLSPRLSVQAASIFAASLALGRFLAGAVMTRLSWYPVLNFCLAMLMVLIASIIPATHGLPAQTITEWGAAPIVAFLFPMIGLFLSPIYPTIVSVMLSAMPKRDHAAIMGLVVVFSALGGTSG